MTDSRPASGSGRRPSLGRKQALPAIPLPAMVATPVHVIVADYPESLHLLVTWGVDTRERGDARLGEVVDEAHLEELHDVLSWRGEDAGAVCSAAPRS